MAVVSVILGKISKSVLPARILGQNSGVLDGAVCQELHGCRISRLADPGLGHRNGDLLRIGVLNRVAGGHIATDLGLVVGDRVFLDRVLDLNAILVLVKISEGMLPLVACV